MLEKASKFITVLAVLPPLASAVIVLVEKFETEGNGEAKKQAVIDTVSVAFDAFEVAVKDTPLTREEVASLTGKIVDVVVTFYNYIGRFTHKE